MTYWKTWKIKNRKFITWYQKKPSKVFSVSWDILQEKSMELVPYSTSKEDILLDVGCGDGRYLFSSIQKRGYFGIGIDPNKEVLLIPAKERIRKAGGKAVLLEGVGECIPLIGSTVSVILCNSILDHAMQPNAVLKEIHRTLKENGILILWQGIHRHKHSEHETHLRVFTKDGLMDMLKDAGFLITDSSFLGCNLFLSSESQESVISRFPQFLNKHLSTLLRIYLLTGKLLPKYASVAILRLRRLGESN